MVLQLLYTVSQFGIIFIYNDIFFVTHLYRFVTHFFVAIYSDSIVYQKNQIVVILIINSILIEILQ